VRRRDCVLFIATAAGTVLFLGFFLALWMAGVAP